ncbi:synaptic vesicle glycoprotein 2C-like isoform X2 [Hyposmocoma kahamanoa]|uniref:synaptic vesicle glycoprotein 2C-like isoform X2 n=1 Tax=Hyposmocoma kahamanoa TaxID=1477025 RepID=UPI000E6D7618|nr:synaptic vesicle glycoprotein 2C-like isoform X2 [Hyposmocoma kahamanoa]
MAAKTTKVSFEDALTMTGFGRFNLAMLVVCASTICAVAYETASVAYLVPANACELNTTSAQQGFMAGIPLIGILLSSNIWGYLGDTRGRRKILLVATCLTFFTAASATLAPNWIVFCVLKFLSSSSMAGSFGLSYTMMSECTPVHRRFTMIQLLVSVFLLSAGSMAALAIPILPLKFSYDVQFLGIQFNSWRVLNIVYSLPCAVAAFCFYLSVESPKFLLSIGREEEALKVLKKIYMINHYDGDYEVTSVYLEEDSSPAVTGFWSSVVSQTTPLFKPPLLKTTLLLGTLFIIVYICSNPYTVWLPYMFDRFMKSLEKGDSGLNYCDMFRSSKSVNTTDYFHEVKDCSLNNIAMMMLIGMNIFLAIVNGLLAVLLRWLSRKGMLITLQSYGSMPDTDDGARQCRGGYQRAQGHARAQLRALLLCLRGTYVRWRFDCFLTANG